ncbi:MAG: hypothetical protein M3Z74_00775 [Pseudomonadota bacterium]|nr:hypothetical protein [Pseudomonadota bacterium]
MNRLTLIVAGFLAFSNFAYAADKAIYKCAESEGVVYRDTPCVNPQEQTLVVAARKVNWQSEYVRANPPVDSRPVDSRLAASPLYAPRLFIGMTDTQVLNLPSWGRPARIVRSKAGRLWREQWIYKDRSTGDERSFLYFENARLVDQEDAPTQPFVQARVTIE